MTEKNFKKKISTYSKQIEFYEKAAEHVVQLLTLFQGLYVASLSFSNLKKIQTILPLGISQVVMDIFLLPIALFLLSIFFAMQVILTSSERPELEALAQNTAKNNEERTKIVREWRYWRDRKYRLLRYSYISMAFAFLLLFVAMGVYLVCLPGIR